MSRLHQHYVVHVLRHDSGFVPELDLVMERGGALYIEGNIDFYDKSCFVVDGIKGTRYHKAPEQEILPYVLLKELQPGFWTSSPTSTTRRRATM